MNQKVFLEFVNPIKDKIYRLSLRLLVSKDAAEDATQEVMIRLWKMKDKLKDYKKTLQNDSSLTFAWETIRYCGEIIYDAFKKNVEDLDPVHACKHN